MGFRPKIIVIKVKRAWVAPALPSVRVLKEKRLKRIVECYRKLYGDDEEVLKVVGHLDYAFWRDDECNGVIFGETLSSNIAKAVNDPSFVLKGVLMIPSDEVGIYTASRWANDKHSIVTYEYLDAGVTLSSVVYINKEIDEVDVSVGRMKEKGHGLIHVSFKDLV